MTTSQPIRTDGRIRLLVTRDRNLAERWADALDAVGIGVLVEIDDAHTALPGSSPLIGVFGAAPLEFAYAVSVPASEREPALAALIDAGWDGRSGLNSRKPVAGQSLLRGAAIIVALVAAFAFLRAAFG